MSWVGKISALKKSVKSLFLNKEQALSTTVPLSDEESDKLVPLLQKWVDEKGYRIPDTTLSDVAARLGTTSLRLHRFCLAQGMDFRSWRSYLRIQDALQEMQEHPHASASFIARRVGFSDRSNFARQFKSVMGVTPLQWKKSQNSFVK